MEEEPALKRPKPAMIPIYVSNSRFVEIFTYTNLLECLQNKKTVQFQNLPPTGTFACATEITAGQIKQLFKCLSAIKSSFACMYYDRKTDTFLGPMAHHFLAFQLEQRYCTLLTLSQKLPVDVVRHIMEMVQ